MNKREWLLKNQNTKDPVLRSAVDTLLAQQFGIQPPTRWRRFMLFIRQRALKLWHSIL